MINDAFVRDIMAYESGDLDDADTLRLYAHLVSTGMAWTLQGFYGRAAHQLIEQGLITAHGDITDAARATDWWHE